MRCSGRLYLAGTSNDGTLYPMETTTAQDQRSEHVRLVAADLRRAGFHGLTLDETSVLVWRSGRGVWADEVLDALADYEDSQIIIHQRPSRQSSTGQRIAASVLVQVL